MLEAHSLSVMRGDRPIFIGLQLRVGAGQALHITGANGSGKTTLLRVLAGLLRPEQGEMYWNGRRLREGELLREAAYLGHRNGLKAELTALENLRGIAALYGFAVDDEHLLRALVKVGMADAAHVAVGVLSQGQQRRVALAGVCASHAPLWLLDEPTTALDQASTSVFEALCAQHLQDGGMLVFANHQPLRLATGQLCELAMASAAPRFFEESACTASFAF